ncbi:hypothetical protein AVEN_248798-1 [Araneus ventricosus]|uniref:Uncharacterized protein n=1 Tax=Araneus ventricosus TaxID=182803 RepID=A0A4Y2SJP8_ARAVE|nr:hypothetical protein AVEN_248798-1 [Araneus ventricosus]
MNDATRKERPRPFKTIRGHLNDSHHNINTGSKDGVLMAITGLGSIHRRCVPSSKWRQVNPHHYCTYRKAISRLLIRRLLIHVLMDEIN